jgi:hypothetical protein
MKYLDRALLVRRCLLCGVFLTLSAGGAGDRRAAGQGPEYVKAHYTKYEYRIPMRDGKRLFTAVYAPKDQSQRYPILLTRTPYSVQPYGVDQYKNDLGPSALFGTAGYIFAYQDVRGRWMSEGQFVDIRPCQAVKRSPQDADESSDAWDTIEWLTRHVANHNGKVGLWGISYPGFYTAAGMIDAHPALAAASPQAPLVDWFIGDDWHHNGALMLAHAFNFMAVFGRPRPQPIKKSHFTFDHETPDGYQFFLELGPLANAEAKYFKGDVPFWSEVMRHGSCDAFWQARNLRPHIKGIRPAVMTVGGWFDAEDLFGTLETHRAVAGHGGGRNLLVMGPWVHGGWGREDGQSLGPVSFGAKTAAFYRESIELPFFESLLKGKGEMKMPGVQAFQTGTNQWRRFEAWPPKQAEAKPLFLHGGSRLAFTPPGDDAPQPSCDEYVSDPARPVPFSNKIAPGMSPEYMVEDQRFAARRPDVLVYQTPVLEEDLAIAGPIPVELQVSTSGSDADWVVKLVDVYPDDYPDPSPNPTGVRMGGYQQMVRGDVMRGKFRNSFEKPEPFTPERPTAVRFTLGDVCHVFRAGHRIMVQVQSSWFPLVDRNPQTFVDIYAAKAADFRKATERVYHSRELASRLVLPVLPAGK